MSHYKLLGSLSFPLKIKMNKMSGETPNRAKTEHLIYKGLKAHICLFNVSKFLG